MAKDIILVSDPDEVERKEYQVDIDPYNDDEVLKEKISILNLSDKGKWDLYFDLRRKRDGE